MQHLKEELLGLCRYVIRTAAAQARSAQAPRSFAMGCADLISCGISRANKARCSIFRNIILVGILCMVRERSEMHSPLNFVKLPRIQSDFYTKLINFRYDGFCLVQLAVPLQISRLLLIFVLNFK